MFQKFAIQNLIVTALEVLVVEIHVITGGKSSNGATQLIRIADAEW
jgi:hypothetical protein